MLSVIVLVVILVSVLMLVAVVLGAVVLNDGFRYAECHYAVRRYAECRYAFNIKSRGKFERVNES